MRLSHGVLTGDFRDRENCTVFVSDLPDGVTEEDLTALFKDVSSTVLPPTSCLLISMSQTVRQYPGGQDNETAERSSGYCRIQ